MTVPALATTGEAVTGAVMSRAGMTAGTAEDTEGHHLRRMVETA